MIYYRRHIYKEALKYVCVDVRSDSTDAWMIYYRCHKYIEALQYVAFMYLQNILVPEWFITNITHKRMLSSVVPTDPKQPTNMGRWSLEVISQKSKPQVTFTG